MTLNERIITPEKVMSNRFIGYSKPDWKVAILCFNNSLSCNVLTKHFNAQPVTGYKVFYGIDADETERQVFEATVSDNKIGIITRLSWGGPQAAILVEELSQLGVQYIFGYGAAGSISSAIHKGELVVGATSILSDGTSRAYLHNRISIDCDIGLLDIIRSVTGTLNINLKEVSAANVDALYRETKQLIAHFQSKGAQIVNLETSALYASAEACGVQSIWLGFISDSLVEESWSSWDTDPTQLSALLSQICLSAIEKLIEGNAS